MGNFHRYIPHTEDERKEMLQSIGASCIEDLFESIPREFRLLTLLNLPEPLSESELLNYFKNIEPPTFISFLGGGAYRHFIPSIVPKLVSRSEFYTAYTPYQAEISQGTLQAIFEYQSLICQLTGMEVSNASMYDGATSLAEAVLMANRITKRPKIIISKAIHPEYRKVLETYIDPEVQKIITIPYKEETGETDKDILFDNIDEDLNAVIIQSPNFFGVIEDLTEVAERVHEKGGIFIVCFSEAIAYGILAPPGMFGADIVSGEGQSLGIPLSYGGPHLGIFTTREKFVRNMPGRLVGETFDIEGRRGFVLTLATREQHIRRERATSNICTNEGLCALMATIFLSSLGKEGLKELALMNLSKTEYTKKRILEINVGKLRFLAPTFNEFVIELKDNPEEVLMKLREKGILGGLILKPYFPELDRHILITVTEMNSKEEIDRFVEVLTKIL